MNESLTRHISAHSITFPQKAASFIWFTMEYVIPIIKQRLLLFYMQVWKL